MEKTASTTRTAKTVFRVRGLPNTIADLESAACFLQAQLGSPRTTSIRVFSLATALPFGGAQTPLSKVATVMLLDVPHFMLDDPDAEEWPVSSDMILDTHFMGMTPLNDVPDGEHVAEYDKSKCGSPISFR